MNLFDELKRIKDHFENISDQEFKENLIECGHEYSCSTSHFNESSYKKNESKFKFSGSYTYFEEMEDVS